MLKSFFPEKCWDQFYGTEAYQKSYPLSQHIFMWEIHVKEHGAEADTD